MRIRVFPEIVYGFVEFTTCKQSHPNANERVTFTLPPVVVFAHSFRTSIEGGFNTKLSQYKTIHEPEIPLSVTRNSTFSTVLRAVDTIKAEIGYMCESGCVVLISLVEYRCY